MATHGEIRWPSVGSFDGRLRGDSHGRRHEMREGGSSYRNPGRLSGGIRVDGTDSSGMFTKPVRTSRNTTSVLDSHDVARATARGMGFLQMEHFDEPMEASRHRHALGYRVAPVGWGDLGADRLLRWQRPYLHRGHCFVGARSRGSQPRTPPRRQVVATQAAEAEMWCALARIGFAVLTRPRAQAALSVWRHSETHSHGTEGT